MIRNIKAKTAGVVVACLVMASHALAEVPSEITDITTNASSVFTTVKGIVVSVVGFGILIGFVKMVRRR